MITRDRQGGEGAAGRITDHVFRPYRAGGPQRAARYGQCSWLGSCTKPEADHITDADFRAARAAR